MRRYWLDLQNKNGEQFTIRGDTFHHIIDVCRQDLGSKFEILCEDSIAYFVQITTLGKKEAIATIIEKRAIPPLPFPKINIALSFPRLATFDMILEKSVELGVAKIQPLVSDYSFFKSLGSVPEKTDRWQKIIMGATQQCGRGDLLKLEAPQNLDTFLKGINPREDVLCLFPYEGEVPLSIKRHLQSINKKPIKDIWLFVGSEGGFSLSEVEMFEQNQIQPVTLGNQILRVETACLTLVSILKYEFDLLG